MLTWRRADGTMGVKTKILISDFFEGRMPKNKLRTKRKSNNHPSLQERKMKSNVVTSSKDG